MPIEKNIPLSVSYHGKSKTVKKGIYPIKRQYFIGEVLFGYVLDVDGMEMLLSKDFPDKGKAWRYVCV